MADDKPFYRRYNFQILKMEEYEIRHAYGRQGKSELMIDKVLCQSAGYAGRGSRVTDAKFLLRFQIRNVGSTIKNQYKLEISIPASAIRYYLHPKLK